MLNPELQQFKYNGKEFDTQHGLNQYDYGFRGFDPAFVRFTTPDPLAEKFPFQSPYVYAANNPVNLIDYKGLAPRTTEEKIAFNIREGETFSGLESWEIGDPLEGTKSPMDKEKEDEEKRKAEEKEGERKSEEEIEKELEEHVAKSEAQAASFLSTSLNLAYSTVGGVGALAQMSQCTYRLTNSKGQFDFRLYKNGWTHNQWVTAKSVAGVGKKISKGATGIGALSLGVDGFLYHNGEISRSQFIYSASKFGVIEGIGLTLGGPAAVAVGTSVAGYEFIYTKMIVPVYQFFLNLEQSFYNLDFIKKSFGY